MRNMLKMKLYNKFDMLCNIIVIPLPVFIGSFAA